MIFGPQAGMLFKAPLLGDVKIVTECSFDKVGAAAIVLSNEG